MIKKVVVIIGCTIFFLFGFDNSDNSEVMSIINKTIDSINNKDPCGYISVLDEDFIKDVYGDKEFIKNNINSFGTITSIYVDIFLITSYYAMADYYMSFKENSGQRSVFYGTIILDKEDKGWKIRFISEEEVGE